MNNQTVLELNNRKLDSCLFSLIIIPTKIYYKEDENLVNEKEIYLFFYCNIQGKRKFLSCVFKDDYKKSSDWYNLLVTFKSRGIGVILYSVIPNNTILCKALKLAFPENDSFISCFESITKLSKYYTITYSNGLFEKVRHIYLSKDLNEYELALQEFKDEFLNYSFIYDLLEDDLKRAKKYYNVDYELRNFIFAFYFYRDHYKKISTISHSKPYFSSLDEFVELLIPDIQRIECRMFCPKKDLINIIDKLYNDKKDLIKLYL